MAMTAQQLGRAAAFAGLYSPMSVGGFLKQRSSSGPGSTTMISPATSRPPVWHSISRRLGELTQKEAFPFSAGALAAAQQSGRQDARVVQDEEIAGRRSGQVREAVMIQVPRLAPHHQQRA